MIAVPQVLEHPVGESQAENVLGRLFAEEAVDPEHRPLGERRPDQLVQLAGRGEVLAERLLDHDAAVGRQLQPDQPPEDALKDGRREGEENGDRVGPAADGPPELLGVGHVRLMVLQPRDGRLADRGREVPGVPLQPLGDVPAEPRCVPRLSTHAEDRAGERQAALLAQLGHCRDEVAGGQVARCSEGHESG